MKHSSFCWGEDIRFKVKKALQAYSKISQSKLKHKQMYTEETIGFSFPKQNLVKY